MKRVLANGLAVCGLVLGSAQGAATASAAPKVVTSIKPVHSLVAGVMAGVGTPRLLIKAGGSPHSYSLRPSEARALNSADLVFWIGEGLETFLDKPLEALTESARVVELAAIPGIKLLKTREGGAWENRDQEHAEHTEYDMHIWLDPHNAKQIVRRVAAELSRADQANAERYEANGKALMARVDRLDREVAATLAPVKDVPYVVFHDAYHYFERRFGTTAVGSISVSPDRAPGARRLTEVRRKIVQSRAACVFSEPQFKPALVSTVIEGTEAKTATLDPLGAQLEPGPEAYFQIMRGLAGSLSACLAPAS